MTTRAVQEFYAALPQRPDLRDFLARHADATDGQVAVDVLVSAARDAGHDVSANDFHAYWQARTQAEPGAEHVRSLDEADLQVVVGGMDTERLQALRSRANIVQTYPSNEYDVVQPRK